MSREIRLNRTPALLGALVVLASASAAGAETRALSLLNTHTQERATIVFKRDGQFDPNGLRELNRMLRDWRRNESTKMDPQLFDLIYEVYRESGSAQPIHIVSGYRSPATNNALRSRSRGVAKFSQHMLGRAMDFYLPDVPLDRLRGIGMKQQFGGVGFYPTSGSPFVHMDTGNVRAWPRMTRDQLVRLFPDGKTAHLPADGAPLPRYEEALAEVAARKGRGETAVASASGSGSGRSIFAAIFGGGSAAPQAEDDDEEGAVPRAAPRPQELRQGPLPAGSPAKVALAEEEGEKFVPPPPPPPKGPVVASATAVPPPPAPPAPGSLVALPVPQAAPRAPGSLIAAAPPAATGNGLPPGWVQGPQGQPGPVAAATPVDVPVPAAKPGSNTVVAALDQTAAVQPRAKPASTGVADAVAVLAPPPAPPGPGPLGYAPPPAAKPDPFQAAGIEPRAGTSVSRAAGAGLVLASLPPSAAVQPGAPASDATRAAAAARSAPKGDRTDPLARLVGSGAASPEARLMDSTSNTRMAGFGVLVHPDQEHLPQLLAKPPHLVMSGFGGGPGGDLRSDRFSGPAVIALVVMRTE
ncbi:DUF882 domain-containing protein [Prosthecomicrobium sp. N25]|uniref:DUF882 domain-containing protein n=1 Tax=Prosthecomicrobium sp. N25 TaxID=3129254 RepID=UPI0030770669